MVSDLFHRRVPTTSTTGDGRQADPDGDGAQFVTPLHPSPPKRRCAALRRVPIRPIRDRQQRVGTVGEDGGVVAAAGVLWRV